MPFSISIMNILSSTQVFILILVSFNILTVFKAHGSDFKKFKGYSGKRLIFGVDDQEGTVFYVYLFNFILESILCVPGICLIFFAILVNDR